MELKGILRKLDCSENKQFNEIGEFWDFMSKLYPKNKLKGLGYNWKNNYIDYVIGDIDNDFDYSVKKIYEKYPDSKCIVIQLPDKGWEIYSGKLNDIENIYKNIYQNGPLDYEIEEIDDEGNFRVSILRQHTLE